MPPRELPPAERRAQILEVAAEIFSEKGYRVATLNDIADRLGFTRAALYYWFSSKQEILTAIVLETGQSLLDSLAQNLAADDSPKDKLRRLLTTHVRIVCENPNPVGVFLAEKSSLTEEDRKRLEAAELEYIHGVAAVVDAGIAQGHFPKQPAVPAALLIVGMVSWVRTWYRPGGDLSVEDLSEMVCRFALGGLERRDLRRSSSARSTKGKRPSR